MLATAPKPKKFSFHRGGRNPQQQQSVRFTDDNARRSEPRAQLDVAR